VVPKGDEEILSHNNVTRIIKGHVTRIAGAPASVKNAGPTLQTDKDLEAYLRKQAGILGFSVEKLRNACDSWAKKPRNNFEQGLAALYEGRNEQAAQALAGITNGVAQTGVPKRDRLAALASTEYRLGNYAEAQNILTGLLADSPHDPRLMMDLAKVAQAQQDYSRALALLQNAVEIDRVSDAQAESDAIELAAELTRDSMRESEVAKRPHYDAKRPDEPK
jgi:tetratricopeptide (TPR) repeat protein